MKIITDYGVYNVPSKTEITAMLQNYTATVNSSILAIVDDKIYDLIGSAPEVLDTIEEIAAAIQHHEDEYDALLEVVGKKAIKDEVYTKEETDDKFQIKGNYLTEHQSLAAYAKSIDVVAKSQVELNLTSNSTTNIPSIRAVNTDLDKKISVRTDSNSVYFDNGHSSDGNVITFIATLEDGSTMTFDAYLASTPTIEEPLIAQANLFSVLPTGILDDYDLDESLEEIAE